MIARQASSYCVDICSRFTAASAGASHCIHSRALCSATRVQLPRNVAQPQVRIRYGQRECDTAQSLEIAWKSQVPGAQATRGVLCNQQRVA